jgi:hypothetical protein
MATDKLIVALAADVGELKRTVEADHETSASHSQLLEQVLKSQHEMLSLIKQLHVANTSLASSVGLAMSELAVARSLERRVDRLEAAVFPSKH